MFITRLLDHVCFSVVNKFYRMPLNFCGLAAQEVFTPAAGLFIQVVK